jgi:hypothetical protein
MGDEHHCSLIGGRTAMSSKEKLIQWMQQLPDDLAVSEILAALGTRYFREKAAGQTPLDYEWPTDDVTEDEWRLFVAQGLRNELEDPREDIYTQEDGVPSDEQG